MSITNCIVISDLHFGCQVALCPPKGLLLDHGGKVMPNKTQLAIWEAWEAFWGDWVPRVTRGEPFVVVVNGDAMDGSHHRSTHQMTQNLEDQVKLAYEVLAPIRDKAEAMYAIRGTEAHVGQSSRDEEELFNILDASKDDFGNATRYELWLDVGDAHCNFAHHIGTSGSMAYQSTAPMKELEQIVVDSALRGVQFPDFVVRSHRHRHNENRVSTYRGNAHVFVTAAWQAKTPFTYRVPGGRVTQPQIGGSIIRQGDEEFYSRHFTIDLPRPRTVKAGE